MKEESMRILITGAAGKLGSTAVESLRQAGHQVTGIDLTASITTDYVIDIRDLKALIDLTDGFDAIIHTAALHGKQMDEGYDRQSFVDTNISGTLNLLNACVQNDIKRFLFISSTSLYGKAMVNQREAVWVTEELQVQPRDIYDITKQACEELCRDFFEKEQIMTSVYRVARFLPEADNISLNHRLYRGLDVRDAAELLKVAVSFTFESFEIFNVSSRSPFKMEDVETLKRRPLEVIAKRVPQAIDLYREKGWNFPETIDRVYNSDKASKILGYNPKFTFEYLLEQFI
ncbi:NAD(P)-dependent oxidoreductase [Chryseobacterium indologenes]|uniref:NAD-dependent epimerase/dehydratase family protein n=1 Tax=Chryseobacterium TaxID=59732 RepID=UPI000F513F08|nr:MULTISPECIES: NAD(P)-dependent oxidoreductase [Chryseobacterium]AYZ36131.1 NAD(P)-dependent oxidoreductase [Chryseobacterium indologenes]MEB4760760.1 NAD(P)-dependent oxidoreductase [Chryseobacterium indologenes]RQO40143.1 hypothetical protein DBR39_04115 [Chryseobacterium sp. KBW03]